MELLTLACPMAASALDKDGMTPLHLAVTLEKPVLAVIEDLTEVCPEAGIVPAETTGSTPLHLAIANPGVGTDILKDLVASNPRALRIKDAERCTPLHVAATVGRSLKDMKVLIKPYRKATSMKNSKGEIPYNIIMSHKKVDKDVRKLLTPVDEV